MTKEEAKTRLIAMKAKFEMLLSMRGIEMSDVFDVAIEALSAEPCEDAVSRQELKAQMIKYGFHAPDMTVSEFVEDLPPATPKQKMGHCKECKYFECDSVANVDGIQLIVAHEICSKWGGGCKTKEDGYCFLFEPQESEG